MNGLILEGAEYIPAIKSIQLTEELSCQLPVSHLRWKLRSNTKSTDINQVCEATIIHLLLVLKALN